MEAYAISNYSTVRIYVQFKFVQSLCTKFPVNVKEFTTT
jgi:hypothetical protein